MMLSRDAKQSHALKHLERNIAAGLCLAWEIDVPGLHERIILNKG